MGNDDFSFDKDLQPVGQVQTDLSKVTEILLNEKWFRRKTNLASRLVAAITTLDTISQVYEITWLRDWIKKYCEYLTSVSGQARQDIVDITKYSIDRKHDENQSMMEFMGKR